MNLATFEAHVQRVWERIPEPLKHDVVALVVEPDVHFDPEFPTTLRLGECMIDPAIANVPEAPIRSLLFIYYGSFVAAAEREGIFDWEGEIEETVHHELRHHLDWREGHDSLGFEDDLERENLLRLEGQPFVRSFYRACSRIAPGVTRLEREIFVELVIRRRHWPTIFERSAQVTIDGVTLTATPADPIDRNERFVFAPVAHYDEPESADAEAPVDPDRWQIATVVFRKKGWLEFGAPPLAARFIAPVTLPEPTFDDGEDAA